MLFGKPVSTFPDHALESAGRREAIVLQALKSSAADFDKFRLRTFVGRLIDIGEAVVHERPVALADLAAAIADTPKAVLFKDAGPEHFQIAAAISGSRRRLAAAFGV